MSAGPELPLVAPATASAELARRLLDIPSSLADDTAVMAIAERVCICVPGVLARWFGPYGSLALVARARGVAEPKHPCLVWITVEGGGTQQRIAGLDASVKAHGVSDTMDGLTALLVALADLLVRLIGDDLTCKLLEQCVAPPTHDQAPAGTS